MNLLVCLKLVLDPDVPARDFRIASSRQEADGGAAASVIDPLSAAALEAALAFRDRWGGTVTAITVGAADSEDVLRKALAVQADAAIFIETSPTLSLNPWNVVKIMAAAARKDGDFQLVLTGKESADWGCGMTAALIAEELRLPCLNYVDDLQASEFVQRLHVRRQLDVGFERLEIELPFVASIVGRPQNTLRLPKTRDIMAAYDSPITRWSLDDLDLDVDVLQQLSTAMDVVEITTPPTKPPCVWITGDSLEERIEKLAAKILTAVDAASTTTK